MPSYERTSFDDFCSYLKVFPYFKPDIRKQEFEAWATNENQIGVGPEGTKKKPQMVEDGKPPKTINATVVIGSNITTAVPPTTVTKKPAAIKQITTPKKPPVIKKPPITKKPSEAVDIESTSAGLNNQEPIKYNKSNIVNQGPMV